MGRIKNKERPNWNGGCFEWKFSCQRKYGRYGQQMERPRDLVDDFRIGIGFKLMKGFNLINSNQFE